MNTTDYVKGSDLPDLGISWYDATGALIDFSTGYDFELKIGQPGETALVTKTGGIAGSATRPNVTITWSTTGELNTLAPGTYRAQLRARRTTDNKQRTLLFNLNVIQDII